MSDRKKHKGHESPGPLSQKQKSAIDDFAEALEVLRVKLNLDRIAKDKKAEGEQECICEEFRQVESAWLVAIDHYCRMVYALDDNVTRLPQTMDV